MHGATLKVRRRLGCSGASAGQQNVCGRMVSPQLKQRCIQYCGRGKRKTSVASVRRRLQLPHYPQAFDTPIPTALPLQLIISVAHDIVLRIKHFPNRHVRNQTHRCQHRVSCQGHASGPIPRILCAARNCVPGAGLVYEPGRKTGARTTYSPSSSFHPHPASASTASPQTHGA